MNWLIPTASAAGVFAPAGPVAAAQKNLIITAVLVMLVIIIPVLVSFFVILRKYRAGANAAHDPEANSGNLRKEALLWAFPIVIVFVLSVILWNAAHALDPFKPIASDKKPLEVQVVALNWKWLFIYPEQGIATVNALEFPAGTPLHFSLTADGPMNLFWIPQLGGQMAAMAGMTTQLNLMADAPGEFAGRASEINGQGLAGMTFKAVAVTQSDFDAWVAQVKQSPLALTQSEYERLAEPSESNPPTFYSSVETGLYNNVMMKYMAPMTSSGSMPMDMKGMNMEGMKM